MATTKPREYIEVGGFIAIIVSLLLLVYEIRQNTLAVQTTALQQHFAQHTELILARLDNVELRASVLKGQEGLEALSREEMGIFGPYASNAMRNHFVAFELMRSGLMEACGHFLSSSEFRSQACEVLRHVAHRRRGDTINDAIKSGAKGEEATDDQQKENAADAAAVGFGV